jgi:hypothetical protein
MAAIILRVLGIVPPRPLAPRHATGRPRRVQAGLGFALLSLILLAIRLSNSALELACAFARRVRSDLPHAALERHLASPPQGWAAP